MLEIRPVLEKVVTDVCAAVCPRTMVVADLGCSSGPNALRFVSDVIRVTGDCCRRSRRDPPELQFFLNDMPGNDFNSLFRSFARRSKKMAMAPHYVVGLPGSFYTRLFPGRTVHFFHSSYSLMWLSQVFYLHNVLPWLKIHTLFFLMLKFFLWSCCVATNRVAD